ncbi:hypothetical protein RclHR1_07590010 [Rhizophagus clarus]|uniref:G-protein coupled receptors family 1 profile domain-containing protein n=1 Tax=Rhizophagus clarus TaxID=94130 RepID=A0A2Z6SLR1_9GLOM|nr:hypothetical protein RclHR1_07590010 [Rhizophagus clarus]GES94156.1 hypothetical protein GLOIN_2v1677556 [Rhizophagus clarus]
MKTLHIKLLCSLLIILLISIQKVSSERLNRTYSIAPNYPNNDRRGLYTLAIPCIICNQLSLVGCFYVLVGTFRRWKAAPTGKIPMTQRVPYYTAITDLLLYMINFPNILYTLIFHKPWPDPMCRIIGFVSNFFMNLNMTLYVMLSILTYVRMCRNEFLILGPYDWKLTLIIFMLSIILSALSFGDYGEDTWWCASSHIHISYQVLLSTSVIIITTFFCYIKVVRKINSIEKTILDVNENSDIIHKRLAEINYKFGTKVATYISIFVLQWVFSFPYHITRIIHDRSVWTFILFGVSVNSGGILNGIQYHINEGWEIKPPRTPNNTSNNNNDQLEQITVTTTELEEYNNSSISSFSSPPNDDIDIL